MTQCCYNDWDGPPMQQAGTIRACRPIFALIADQAPPPAPHDDPGTHTTFHQCNQAGKPLPFHFAWCTPRHGGTG
jgi:hypothetical protein